MTHDEIIELLMAQSPRTEAAYLALKAMGEARTGEIAAVLKIDRPNAGKLLEKLESQGRAVVVDTHDVLPSRRGRPSRRWAIVA